MATITVTRRIITAMIVTVPRSKVTVNKAMVDMVINPLMDTVITLPMGMDINPTDKDINLLMVDTVINLTVMVMDTNLLTVKTTTNNPMATVTNPPTDMDNKVTEAMVTNSLMVDMVISNLMVNMTVTTRNLTEHHSDSNFISVITQIIILSYFIMPLAIKD